MPLAILIVDDDKFTRTVLESVFQQDPAFAGADITVHSAGDGEEGLRLIRDIHPQVVIVDLLMPKIDGFELCKRVRQEASGGQVHIFGVSGVYRDVAISQRLRNEYRAEFYTKPYQLKDLAQKVARLVPATPGQLASKEHSAPVAIPFAQTGAVPVAAPPPVPRPATRTEPPDSGRPRMHTTPPPDFAKAGELSQRGLPAVILDLLDARATGHLLIKRGKVNKRISLLVGHPVNASSNIRDETLGHFLVQSGAIDVEQHKIALKRAAGGEARLGEALIAMGAISPEQLIEQLTAQLRYKIASALRWPDGVWQFDAKADPKRAGANAIDTVQLIVTGLQNTGTFTPMPEHLARLESATLSLNARGQKLLPQLGDRIASIWFDQCTVHGLLGRKLERHELYAGLDVLLLCDALTVTRGAQSATGAHDVLAPISVEDLSEHSQVARLPRPPDSGDLYSLLFDDASGAHALPLVGEAPLQVSIDAIPQPAAPGDSGFVDVRNVQAQIIAAAAEGSSDPESNAARRMLYQEYLRIQGIDHYEVIGVAANADAVMIAAAVVERRTKFAREWFARFDLGRDYAKLEELHAAYDAAFRTLLDEQSRWEYDRRREDPSGVFDTPPSLDADLNYSEADELLRSGRFEEACRKLEEVIRDAPNEASYYALLGWAYYLCGGRTAQAGDRARPHLNQALAINPDHAIAHEYKGVIGAELGTDDVEALFHLERALDADPGREEALRASEKVWRKRAEFRPLERQYRRLIYRAAGRNGKLELALWLRLAELYRNELDDAKAARVSYTSALSLAPEDPAIQAALADLDSGRPDRFFERSEVLRAHWLRDPANAGPGLELMRAAEQAQHSDAAFMAASALIARNFENAGANELYQRFRPRFVLRAQKQLFGEYWEAVKHPDDSSDIGTLFELLAPIVNAAIPLTFDDLDVDEADAVADSDLPNPVVRIRDYVAHMLGVPVPRVYLRPDFGRQVHVGAVPIPVILAGDQTVAAPERSELAFRLGRAMTYLWPGRALAGARPARYLKYAVLAAVSHFDPRHSPSKDPEGVITKLKNALTMADPALRDELRYQLGWVTQRFGSLDLSRWARALARTADRVGLLLSGDLPAAVRFCQDGATPAQQDELIDFAISASHLHLRSQLGLSVEV